MRSCREHVSELMADDCSSFPHGTQERSEVIMEFAGQSRIVTEMVKLKRCEENDDPDTGANTRMYCPGLALMIVSPASKVAVPKLKSVDVEPARVEFRLKRATAGDRVIPKKNSAVNPKA